MKAWKKWGAGMVSLIQVGHAQSQPFTGLKIGGTMDVAIRHVNHGSAGRATVMAMDGLHNSEIHLNGREDLGSGWWSGFSLNSGVNPDTGSANTPFFNRRSTLSLGGPWGELRAGRDLNPSVRNLIVFDPFSNGVGNFKNLVSALGSGARTLLRAENSLSWFSPPGLGGFYGHAMVAAGEGVPGNRYAGAHLGWRNERWHAGLGWSRTRAALGADYLQFNYGLSRDFGGARLMGVVHEVRYGARRQTSSLLALTVPYGPGFFRAGYGLAHMDGPVSTQDIPWGRGDDARQWAVGYVYPVSQRTAFYASFSALQNNGFSRMSVSSQPSPAAMRGGESVKGLEFGIRHFF